MARSRSEARARARVQMKAKAKAVAEAFAQAAGLVKPPDVVETNKSSAEESEAMPKANRNVASTPENMRYPSGPPSK